MPDTMEMVNSIPSCSRDIEIIVVDNGSRLSERSALEMQLAKDCRLVKSAQNVGFGGGNMLGANFATGDYLCFLNSDIVFEEDCVSPLIKELEQDSSIGCITPQQYDGYHRFVRSFNHEHSILNKAISKSLLERLFPSKYPSRKAYTQEENSAGQMIKEELEAEKRAREEAAARKAAAAAKKKAAAKNTGTTGKRGRRS